MTEPLIWIALTLITATACAWLVVRLERGPVVAQNIQANAFLAALVVVLLFVCLVLALAVRAVVWLVAA